MMEVEEIVEMPGNRNSITIFICVTLPLGPEKRDVLLAMIYGVESQANEILLSISRAMSR